MSLEVLFEKIKGYFREEDIEKVDVNKLELKSLGYEDMTDFKLALYPFDINKVYATKSPISPFIYVDYDSFIQVELYNLSKAALTDFVKPDVRYKHSIECISKDNYLGLYMCMFSNMLALDFIKNYKRIPKEHLLIVFKYVYQNQDYNFDVFPKGVIREVFDIVKNSNSKSDKVIKIYRGVGSKSLALEEAFSWTTSLEVAKFFATRFNTKGKIYEGYVNECDITYISEDGEHEVLCFFEDIKDIKEIEF